MALLLYLSPDKYVQSIDRMKQWICEKSPLLFNDVDPELLHFYTDDKIKDALFKEQNKLLDVLVQDYNLYLKFWADNIANQDPNQLKNYHLGVNTVGSNCKILQIQYEQLVIYTVNQLVTVSVDGVLLTRYELIVKRNDALLAKDDEIIRLQLEAGGIMTGFIVRVEPLLANHDWRITRLEQWMQLKQQNALSPNRPKSPSVSVWSERVSHDDVKRDHDSDSTYSSESEKSPLTGVPSH